MALIKCIECGKEISDKAHKCPNCGFPIQQVSQNKTKPKKKGCSLPFLITILVIVGLTSVITSIFEDFNSPNATTSPPSEDITLIEDAEQFSQISTSELKSILGEPISEEQWTNKTSKGNFEVTTLSYDINSNHYEFIVADASVVRLSIYSNSYWNNEGNRFTINGEKEDICKSFNITLDDTVKEMVDNNFTYKLSTVNDKIAIFDVQDIDTDTYGFVKITYNINYFD